MAQGEEIKDVVLLGKLDRYKELAIKHLHKHTWKQNRNFLARIKQIRS